MKAVLLSVEWVCRKKVEKRRKRVLTKGWRCGILQRPLERTGSKERRFGKLLKKVKKVLDKSELM